MYLVNCFRFLSVSSLLFTGHLPTLIKQLFRFCLSFCSLLHWNNKWSTVCKPFLHGHSGLVKFLCLGMWQQIVFVTLKAENSILCFVAVVRSCPFDRHGLRAKHSRISFIEASEILLLHGLLSFQICPFAFKKYYHF